MQNKKGFTLLELLVIVGILAILAAIVLVAVDPARRFAEARNSQRWSAANGIVNAYLSYVVDNHGMHPVATDTSGMAIVDNVAYEIGTSTGIASCTATSTPDMKYIDLAPNLVPQYVSSLPIDPASGSPEGTGFYFIKNVGERITIGACEPERREVIRVQR